MVEMVSDNELIAKIKKELLQSGFPLEIQCREEILRRGWRLSALRIYKDAEGIEHEIDAVGHKQVIFSFKSTDHNMVQSNVIVECKKNKSNHFVFFDEGLHFPNLNVISTLGEDENKNLENLNPEPLKKCHYFKMTPTSSFCMAFRKERNQLFEAVSDVFSAYRHWRERTEKFMKKRNRESGIRVNVYYPVIVFDGRIFIAKMVNGDLEVEEVKQALYVMMPLPDFNRYVSIDIVSADIFSNYLESLEHDSKIIVSHIKSRQEAI